MKEGLYSDHANRETLLELIRVKTTKSETWTSLKEVKARMQEGQKGIYFLTGGPAAQLRTSPLLEIYRKKDIEVLILDDEIDEFVFAGIEKYDDVELKAVNKASTSEDLKTEEDKDKGEELKPLVERLKKALEGKVKDVRASVRLADSPSCIVSDEEEPSLKMRQMLRAMGQAGLPDSKPILEVNPDHEIVKKLQGASDDAFVSDAAHLLLEQALLIEGVTLENPAAFVQRLNRVLSRAS
jgi:molecular chaperone HtpG